VLRPRNKVECYQCHAGCHLILNAKDLTDSRMVFLYLYSDTMVRKYEDDDSSMWPLETGQKSGLCYGSFFIIQGPIKKSASFNTHTKAHIFDTRRIIDEGLQQKVIQKMGEGNGFLPGRSLSIVSKKGSAEFQKTNGQAAHICLDEGGAVNVEKDILTGEFRLDVFC
jgi:hypothetical protein